MVPGSQRNCKPRALDHLGASQLQKSQRASTAQAPGRILLIQPLGTCQHQPPPMALSSSWWPLGSQEFPQTLASGWAQHQANYQDQVFDPTHHQANSHNPRIPCHLMSHGPLWVQTPDRLLQTQAPSLLSITRPAPRPYPQGWFPWAHACSPYHTRLDPQTQLPLAP